jgi:hypothetical protein
VKSLILAVYLRAGVPVIGLLSGGRPGLGFGSLYQTYLLTLDNDMMVRLLNSYFRDVVIKTSQLGGAIVAMCSGKTQRKATAVC